MNPQVLATLIDALEAEGNESSIVANDAGRAWELLNAAREILGQMETETPAPESLDIDRQSFTTDGETWVSVGKALITVGPIDIDREDGKWWISVLTKDRTDVYQEEIEDGKAAAYYRAKELYNAMAAVL